MSSDTSASADAPSVIQQEIGKRTGHFMNPALLSSQLEILEPPEDAIKVDVTGTPVEIANEIRAQAGAMIK